MIQKTSLLWLIIVSSTTSFAEFISPPSLDDYVTLQYTKDEVKELLGNFTEIISKGHDFFVSDDNCRKFGAHLSAALKFEALAQVSGTNFLLPPNTDKGNKMRRDTAAYLLHTQMTDRKPFPKTVELIGLLTHEELRRRTNEHPLLVSNMILEILRVTVGEAALLYIRKNNTHISTNFFTSLSNSSNVTGNDFYFPLDDLIINGVNETKIDRFFEIISPVKGGVERRSQLIEISNELLIQKQIDEEEECKEQDNVTCVLNFTYWMSLNVIVFILGFIVRDVLGSRRSSKDKKTQMKTYVPIDTKANAYPVLVD